MERTVYTNINEKINVAIMQREAQKNILEKAIADNRSIIKQASEIMTDATIASDLKAYKEAKEKRNEARDALELYEARADHLEKQAYISDDEGEKIAKQIKEEQEKAVKKAMQDIKPLLKQIDLIAMQALNIVDEGNDLIGKWHMEVAPFKKLIGYKGEVPTYANDAPYYYAKDFRYYINNSIKGHLMFLEITADK